MAHKVIRRAQEPIDASAARPRVSAALPILGWRLAFNAEGERVQLAASVQKRDIRKDAGKREPDGRMMSKRSPRASCECAMRYMEGAVNVPSGMRQHEVRCSPKRQRRDRPPATP